MTKTLRYAGLAVSVLALTAMAAGAQEVVDDQLVVNGEIPIVTEAPAPDYASALGTIRSGWTFRSEDTQMMQADDFDNPGMLGVEAARAAFNSEMGTGGESCASCHDDPESLSTVRGTYPKWDEEHGTVQTVEMQVQECQTERMGMEEPYGYNSTDMINMVALLSSVARGTPVNVAIDGPAEATWKQGEEMYYTRYGQLELSCANCHEDNYDNMIRADHLSQGQINAFPAYRLKDAALVSVQNRFRGCIRDTMGETFAVGSPEFVALELYVASRGNGLSVEGPSVRN
ncbi:sulfur oxidation c-type cytochrome SoxA [Paracoccus albicereus]|uniref:sulfur oxidation c-type cytochrome SoxA n=1 Tax=Paracoccus albicereus TaxID=2922394 RepID=UPI003F75D606